MIVIVDYGGSGNLRSVQKVLQKCEPNTIISKELDDIVERAQGLVLPGVGAFGDAMQALEEQDLVDLLNEHMQIKPTLGICLGMQLLFDSSAESPGVKGLGIVNGTVRKIKAKNGIKVPHTGWNKIRPIRKPYLSGYAYFNHSYYCDPIDTDCILSYALHGVRNPAIILQDNILATQFHPEKSQKTGLAVIQYWYNYMVKETEEKI